MYSALGSREPAWLHPRSFDEQPNEACKWKYLYMMGSRDSWLYGVHRTCAEMAAVSHGICHTTTKTVLSVHNFGAFKRKDIFYFF